MNLETLSIARQRELRQLSLDIQAGGMAFGEEHKRRANLVSEAIIQMTIEAKRDLKT